MFTVWSIGCRVNNACKCFNILILYFALQEEPYDIDALNNVKCDAGIDDRVCVVGDNM
jgi:hypothetical protein